MMNAGDGHPVAQDGHREVIVLADAAAAEDDVAPDDLPGRRQGAAEQPLGKSIGEMMALVN